MHRPARSSPEISKRVTFRIPEDVSCLEVFSKILTESCWNLRKRDINIDIASVYVSFILIILTNIVFITIVFVYLLYFFIKNSLQFTDYICINRTDI